VINFVGDFKRTYFSDGGLRKQFLERERERERERVRAGNLYIEICN
jgi:hypothetical protein